MRRRVLRCRLLILSSLKVSCSCSRAHTPPHSTTVKRTRAPHSASETVLVDLADTFRPCMPFKSRDRHFFETARDRPRFVYRSSLFRCTSTGSSGHLDECPLLCAEISRYASPLIPRIHEAFPPINLLRRSFLVGYVLNSVLGRSNGMLSLVFTPSLG